MFMFNELTGLLIISKIQSIVQNQLGKSADYAAGINSALGGMNLLGRLVIPVSSDLVKQRKPFFMLSLVLQSILLGVLPTAINNQKTEAVLFCAFLIAFFYGGGFGIVSFICIVISFLYLLLLMQLVTQNLTHQIPAFLADQFGSANVGATHGMILTAWAFAGVAGGLTFNAVYTSQKAYLTSTMGAEKALLYVYNVDFRWILAFVILGFFLCIFIPANIKDRKLPRCEGEWVRFRFVNNRLVRVINGKPIMLTKQEEKAEWMAYLETLRKQEMANLDAKSSPTSQPVIVEVDGH